MELIETKDFPETRYLVSGIELDPSPVGDCGQQLDIVQQELAFAILTLDCRLRGVGATVVLEVELTDEDGVVAGFALESRKELFARALRCAGDSLQIADSPQYLEHLLGRAAAAVSVAEEEIARVRPVVVFVIVNAPADLSDVRNSVVRIRRREVRQDRTPVDPLPEESVVCGLVERVPRQFLG